MNYKAIILISLSVIGISFASWKMSSKQKWQKNNKQHKNNYQSLYNVNQKEKKEEEKKEEEKVVPKEEKNSSFLLIIIIIVVVFLIIMIVFYKLSKKKQKKFSPEELSKMLNNHINQDQFDSSLLKIVQDNLKNDNEKNYENFECGVSIDPNDDKLQIIFCQKFDRDNFFDQLWKLDVEEQLKKINKSDFSFKPLQETYDNLSKNKKKIKKLYNLIIDFLQIINYDVLKKTIESTYNIPIIRPMAEKLREEEDLLKNPSNANENKKKKFFLYKNTRDVSKVSQNIKDLTDFQNKNSWKLLITVLQSVHLSYFNNIENIFLEHFYYFFCLYKDVALQLQVSFLSIINDENIRNKVNQKKDEINNLLESS